MTHTRDEELFWRMLDAYGEPSPFGISSRNEMKGIRYTITNKDLIHPWLEVSCLVNGTGVRVWICTNYQGCGEEKAEELEEQIPEYEEIAAKFYFWEDFKFDSFINWTISVNKWETVLELYALKSQ